MGIYREIVRFLACAVGGSTYLVGILHMIKIIIMIPPSQCHHMSFSDFVFPLPPAVAEV